MMDPAADGAVTNGAFENFTAGLPDNWTASVGTATTHFDEDTSSEYSGTKCLKYIGDSSTLTALTQNLSGLSSRTPLPVSVQLKLDVVPAAGNLIIDLYDGTAVITDDEAANNSLSIDLTAGDTTYVHYTDTFRLPSVLPATVTLRVRLSTALTTGSNLFLDNLFVGDDNSYTEMYAGGPRICQVRGSVDAGVDDLHVVTMANGREGAIQTLTQRLFDQNDLMLPSDSAGGETVADSLIG